MQYAEYSLVRLDAPANGLEATQTATAEHGPPPPGAEDPKQDVLVTPGKPNPPPGAGGKQFATEEKIEYRDEDGNLLNEAQVAAIKAGSASVSFSTRYETRTRVVDEFGNEVEDGVAGTLAEGVEFATVEALGEGDANAKPPRVGAKGDLKKEGKVEAAGGRAEPGSEPEKKTGR